MSVVVIVSNIACDHVVAVGAVSDHDPARF